MMSVVRSLTCLLTCLLAVSVHASSQGSLRIIAGNANPELAQGIADELQAPLCGTQIRRFNDGEVRIEILDDVRGDDVYLIQPTCRSFDASVNDNLLELLLTVRCAKRASSASVTAVIPYYGYGRQDRKDKPQVPISASDVAMLLEAAGVDHVLAVDLHCGQIQGFFQHTPVDNLPGALAFLPHVAALDLERPVVVSPDAGGVERAKAFRDGLRSYGVESDLAIIVKQRKEAAVIERVDLVGVVLGSDAIIVDDLCDTAGTLCRAAQELKQRGARRVFACITHPVFSGPALERIGASVISELIVSDSIPLPGDAPDNITQISISPLIADAIRTLRDSRAVSYLNAH